MDKLPPPATVLSALQEFYSDQHKSLIVINSQVDYKGDWGFARCLEMKMYLVTFWFFCDFSLSGDENLASLKITAIIVIFDILLGLRVRVDYQGSTNVKFM